MGELFRKLLSLMSPVEEYPKADEYQSTKNTYDDSSDCRRGDYSNAIIFFQLIAESRSSSILNENNPSYPVLLYPHSISASVYFCLSVSDITLVRALITT